MKEKLMSHAQDVAHKTEGRDEHRRTGLMGIRGLVWMGIVWITVILAFAFPFPWLGLFR
jgi:hypothetical protein